MIFYGNQKKYTSKSNEINMNKILTRTENKKKYKDKDNDKNGNKVK